MSLKHLVIAVLVGIQSTMALAGLDLGLGVSRSGFGVSASRDTNPGEFIQGTLGLETSLRFSADYCWSRGYTGNGLSPYLGAGLALFTSDKDAQVGVRVPLGIRVTSIKSPVISLEMAPTLMLADIPFAFLDLGVSIRVPL